MKNNQHPVLFSKIIVVIALGCFCFVQTARALSAPTITLPKNGATIPPDKKLAIAGLSANNATIYLLVDTKIIQVVKVKNGKKGTGSFVFRISSGRFSVGSHTFIVRAYVGDDKSPYTNKRSFRIPKNWPRRIDGVIVPSRQANSIPTAVMIENLSSVRPQAGLSSASIVYETLAEGGIPRFLALFAREDMVKVGPVRSIRPYFVDWTKEYQAPLLHAGGSRDAFNEVGRIGVRSIDALLGKTSKYFSRIGRSLSTHNLFSSGTKITKMRSDYKFVNATATFVAWKFKNDPILAKRPNEKRHLEIDFRSGKAYTVAYYYDRASNSYYRFNGAKQQTDANNPKHSTIRIKNVVVQRIEKERVLDKKGRLDLQITGKGSGWIAQDGKIVPITWKKQNASSRTIYRYANGQEVALNRGSTWIEVVPKNRPVLYR